MINTKHIEEHEVILTPSIKDFKGKSFSQAVAYIDIFDLENNDNIKNTKIIQERLKSQYPKNKKEDFNYSFYLNPKYSDITVIDFDDYQVTLEKLKFLCKSNRVFRTYWEILEKEVFNKTFTVTTPSCGKHYYMRIPNKTIFERIVTAIDPADFLTEEQLQTFIEYFEIKADDENKLKRARRIKIDFIPNGMIHGPGILMKNVKKKDAPPKDRYYKITKNVPLINIDGILKPILEYIFKPKRSKSKNQKSKTLKSNYELLDTKLLEIIKNIDEIEKLQITNSSKAISKVSKNLSNIKTQFTAGNTDIFSKNSVQERQCIEEWFNREKENLIKEAYLKTPETEYIYNILYKQKVAESYKDRNYDLYPKILLENVINSKPGERSEVEMAFITNLKIRNFEDIFIKYLVYKSFPQSSRCIEDPSFLNQALQVATALSNFPESLNKKDKSWIKILQSICLIRKIDFSVYKGLNSDKARVALETLYNWASVTNNFTITLPLKELTLISLGRLNFKTLRKYLLIFEAAGFIDNVSWEKDEKENFFIRKGSQYAI
ncbi:hypothetical protein [Leptospira barantonii]|uniref:Primase C-terminal 1 domain-containing protein n=1 Tax=Leptospira barantonii TaxID=2023184 RepID=A0ABX4NKU9_9LEPT|nr:hypothetical protein [Leptospira barantonii]PJZ57461.1 hypothetical protein CH367_08895 [Leptospira barantonii]